MAPRRGLRGGRGLRRTTGDPYGLAAASPFLAPLLSLGGLAVAAALTIALLTGSLPFQPLPGDGNGGPLVPGRTPAPHVPPVVNPEVGISGQLVYARAGNLWILEGTTTRQLTATERDSQPAWSADGAWIYFIETRQRRARFPIDGRPVTYELFYPILTRIRPDGSEREAVRSGLYRTGPADEYMWAYFIRDPAVAPDGTTVAVVSDGPDPTRSNVVLALVDVARRRLQPLGVQESPPYGHQDPAWRPDGEWLVYVRNQRENGRGAPAIWRYEVATGEAVRLSEPGYTEPLYSADGRYLVATRTTPLGTDVVVLDGRNGNELIRVTNDGRSWGGAWSPDGTQVAFLRLVGSTADMFISTIGRGPGGRLVVEDTEQVTERGGLDPESRPAWWGPRPAPGPTPTPATPTPAP